MRIAGLLLVFTLAAHGQWTLQDSHTTASLRGIDSVGNGVAWASGTEGTVLRTEDGGATWQRCSVPPGAEALDFRGVQAFDAKTAIVMSSGKGDLSRLYKTADGCQTWRWVLKNPDPEGFWDALVFQKNVWGSASGLSQTHPRTYTGYLLGDPVGGNFVLFETQDTGESWTRWREDAGHRPLRALPKDGAFAASNTSLISPGFHRDFGFVSGGANGSRLMIEEEHLISDRKLWLGVKTIALPLAAGESAGAFSVAARYRPYPHYAVDFMIVGGDYQKTADTTANAVFISATDSRHPIVQTPVTPPHGFRSAVAWSAGCSCWITVGPNGTDISTDDGRNWRALRPGPGDATDADQQWNALSLPFVVGPKGRIGVLRGDALTKAASK